jgi:2,3-bisphosphoglycerate-independent phosphoglycerate mutase
MSSVVKILFGDTIVSDRRPTVLCILDGFGLNPREDANAVALGRTPTFDRIWEFCPHSTLTTFGKRVGLPEGQMGNSEVGHLNIGAGRVIEQWLVRIERELKQGQAFETQAYKNFLVQGKTAPCLHLIGLFSDGGVHSLDEHLTVLLTKLRADFQGQIALHLITDGRDTSPTQAADKIEALEKSLGSFGNVVIASVSGRFFAMDRDKRWERIEKAYRVIAEAQGSAAGSASEYVRSCYEKGLTDEFIEPQVISPSPVGPNDLLLFWNFRADRMREIVTTFCSDSFASFPRNHGALAKEQILCFTEYDETYGLPVLFRPILINNYLGVVVSAAGKTQLRIAETEKYPHVTYFLNGGEEVASAGEERSMVPSPRDVKTYDLKPEMSAAGVCELVIAGIESGKYDLIVVNFANCDMVGHTGVLSAAIKAVETVDACLGRILDTLDAKKGNAVIIADHGNAEQMIDYETGEPHTSHTMYPVPVVLYNVPEALELKSDMALCDVAPTLLKMMGIPQPTEMTGTALY